MKFCLVLVLFLSFSKNGSTRTGRLFYLQEGRKLNGIIADIYTPPVAQQRKPVIERKERKKYRSLKTYSATSKINNFNKVQAEVVKENTCKMECNKKKDLVCEPSTKQVCETVETCVPGYCQQVLQNLCKLGACKTQLVLVCPQKDVCTSREVCDDITEDKCELKDIVKCSDVCQ